MRAASNNTSEKTLKVRRGRVDSVDLFEVKENELEILEHGEPTGIYLNFGIFLLSIALTGISALCTATFSNTLTQNSFLFVSIIGVLGGVFLMVLWWRGRKSIRSVIAKIRNRIPPEAVDDGGDDDVEPVENDQNIPPQG